MAGNSQKSSTLPPGLRYNAQAAQQQNQQHNEESKGIFSKLRKKFKLKKGKYTVDVNTGECENVSAVSFRKTQVEEAGGEDSPWHLRDPLAVAFQRDTRSQSPKQGNKSGFRTQSDRFQRPAKSKHERKHSFPEHQILALQNSPKLDLHSVLAGHSLPNPRTGNQYSKLDYDNKDLNYKTVNKSELSKNTDQIVRDDSAIGLRVVGDNGGVDIPDDSLEFSIDPGYEKLPNRRQASVENDGRLPDKILVDPHKSPDWDPRYESINDVKQKLKERFDFSGGAGDENTADNSSGFDIQDDFDPRYQSVSEAKGLVAGTGHVTPVEPGYQSVDEVKGQVEALAQSGGLSNSTKERTINKSLESLDEPGYEAINDVKNRLSKEIAAKSDVKNDNQSRSSTENLHHASSNHSTTAKQGNSLQSPTTNDHSPSQEHHGRRKSGTPDGMSGIRDLTETALQLTEILAVATLTSSSNSKDSGFQSKDRSVDSQLEASSENLYSVIKKSNSNHNVDSSKKTTPDEASNSVTHLGSNQSLDRTTYESKTLTNPTDGLVVEGYDSDVELSLDPGYAECADAIKGFNPYSIYSDGSGSKISSCTSLDLSADDFMPEPGYAECADAIKTGAIKKISVSRERLFDSSGLKSDDMRLKTESSSEIYANPQILFRKRSKLLEAEASLEGLEKVEGGEEVGEGVGGDRNSKENIVVIMPNDKKKRRSGKVTPPEAPPLPARNYSLYLENEEAEQVVNEVLEDIGACADDAFDDPDDDNAFGEENVRGTSDEVSVTRKGSDKVGAVGETAEVENRASGNGESAGSSVRLVQTREKTKNTQETVKEVSENNDFHEAKGLEQNYETNKSTKENIQSNESNISEENGAGLFLATDLHLNNRITNAKEQFNVVDTNADQLDTKDDNDGIIVTVDDNSEKNTCATNDKLDIDKVVKAQDSCGKCSSNLDRNSSSNQEQCSANPERFSSPNADRDCTSIQGCGWINDCSSKSGGEKSQTNSVVNVRDTNEELCDKNDLNTEVKSTNKNNENYETQKDKDNECLHVKVRDKSGIETVLKIVDREESVKIQNKRRDSKSKGNCDGRHARESARAEDTSVASEEEARVAAGGLRELSDVSTETSDSGSTVTEQGSLSESPKPSGAGNLCATEKEQGRFREPSKPSEASATPDKGCDCEPTVVDYRTKIDTEEDGLEDAGTICGRAICCVNKSQNARGKDCASEGAIGTVGATQNQSEGDNEKLSSETSTHNQRIPGEGNGSNTKELEASPPMATDNQHSLDPHRSGTTKDNECRSSIVPIICSVDAEDTSNDKMGHCGAEHSDDAKIAESSQNCLVVGDANSLGDSQKDGSGLDVSDTQCGSDTGRQSPYNTSGNSSSKEPECSQFNPCTFPIYGVEYNTNKLADSLALLSVTHVKMKSISLDSDTSENTDMDDLPKLEIRESDLESAFDSSGNNSADNIDIANESAVIDKLTNELTNFTGEMRGGSTNNDHRKRETQCELILVNAADTFEGTEKENGGIETSISENVATMAETEKVDGEIESSLSANVATGCDEIDTDTDTAKGNHSSESCNSSLGAKLDATKVEVSQTTVNRRGLSELDSMRGVKPDVYHSSPMDGFKVLNETSELSDDSAFENEAEENDNDDDDDEQIVQGEDNGTTESQKSRTNDHSDIGSIGVAMCTNSGGNEVFLDVTTSPLGLGGGAEGLSSRDAGILAENHLTYQQSHPNLYEDSEPTHMSLHEVFGKEHPALEYAGHAEHTHMSLKEALGDNHPLIDQVRQKCKHSSDEFSLTAVHDKYTSDKGKGKVNQSSGATGSSHIPNIPNRDISNASSSLDSSSEAGCQSPPPRPPPLSTNSQSKEKEESHDKSNQSTSSQDQSTAGDTPTAETPATFRFAYGSGQSDEESPPVVPPRARTRKTTKRPVSYFQDFMESMRQLKDCGWYWGPLSWEEAEMKLAKKPEGTFLVRDSSDERYILSLSFKNQGRVHHTRIEHHKGHFSFWSQPESHGKSTIKDFIEQCVTNSRNGRFLYFIRPSGPGSPPMPIHLLHPVSRFIQMRSLQHMCRFSILQLVRRDHIEVLPIPTSIKQYLKAEQYYVEYLDD